MRVSPWLRALRKPMSAHCAKRRAWARRTVFVPSSRLDQVTSLLTVWHTQPGFSGAYGLALELDLQPTAGSPRRSFRELIEVACRGVDSEALLDELVAAGSVEVIDGNTVRCLSSAYLPQGADTKRIERMGRFLASVAASFVHNVLRLNSDPVYFERAVHSGRAVDRGGRDKFLALTASGARNLLAELDTFLTRLARVERSDSGKKYGVGIYFFEDQADGAWTRSQTACRTRSSPPMQEIDVLAGLGNHQK